MKLSKTQEEVLAKMKDEEWYSSYSLGVKISTLRALTDKKILVSKSGLGSIFSPTTSILFKKKKENNGKEN